MTATAIWITCAVGLAAFVVNLIVLSVTLTRALSKTEAAIRDEIHKHRKEIDEERERESRVVGESLQGLRTKLFEVELWIRDELKDYALRESVHTLGGRLETMVVRTEERLLDQFKGLNSKVDRLISTP